MYHSFTTTYYFPFLSIRRENRHSHALLVFTKHLITRTRILTEEQNDARVKTRQDALKERGQK